MYTADIDTYTYPSFFYEYYDDNGHFDQNNHRQENTVLQGEGEGGMLEEGAGRGKGRGQGYMPAFTNTAIAMSY